MNTRLLSVLALAATTACSGGGETAGGTSRPVKPGACGQPDAKLVAAAVPEFIRTAQPRAVRYLVPATSDTSLPEAGRAALQMKGQTFLYPNDSAMRQQIINRLSDAGEYTTMLVAYKGTKLVARDSAVVQFAGHYIATRGVPSSPSIQGEVPFVCQTVWKLARTVKPKT